MVSSGDRCNCEASRAISSGWEVALSAMRRPPGRSHPQRMRPPPGVTRFVPRPGTTGFLTGIVLGQLLLGPHCDGFGRRPVLLVGVSGFAIVSAAAALAPGIVWFNLARLVQGFCGAAGLVVARAVIMPVPEVSRASLDAITLPPMGG